MPIQSAPTRHGLRAAGPYDDLLLAAPVGGADRRLPLRQRLQSHGQFGPGQLAGRLFPMACVALEVTQRCNLDCTLCYLSDMAEAVPDVPLAELMRRIDRIHAQFGPDTNVQITGGDPTLRPLEDLVAITRRIRALGMRSALFTNGIRASRAMLTALADAGMDDVCFHVDTTQQRKGYATEADLHAVRAEYLARTEGLGLRINFNTTVHDGNVTEIAGLVRWFTAHADRVNLASFQMQAETGRGVLGARDSRRITQEGLMATIWEETQGAADFDVFGIGHADCNRHCSILVADDRTGPLYADPGFFRQIFALLAKERHDWNRDGQVIRAALKLLLSRPGLLLRGLGAAWRTARPLLPALLRGQRPHRLSFFIHNFMSADAIDRTRCESCVFMVMTGQGPLSMCAHNADRDRYVMAGQDATRLKGALAFKQLKGRLRARAARQREKEKA